MRCRAVACLVSYQTPVAIGFGLPSKHSVNPEYLFHNAELTHANRYLWKPLRTIIEEELPKGQRIFEIGCGNGATAGMLGELGYELTGVDTSESGISIAKQANPDVTFKIGSAYDDLAARYGQFPVVLSLEVIEHCFWPRKFAKTAFELAAPGGLVIISTPYHGYLKNIALALTNKLDSHFTALWDGGHIKFWSRKTLYALLKEAGFSTVSFRRIGRIAPLAKSMIAIARKPK